MCIRDRLWLKHDVKVKNGPEVQIEPEVWIDLKLHMVTPLPKLSTGLRQQTSDLSGNVRTLASRTAMKLVFNRTSWISFDPTKILSTQHTNITGNNHSIQHKMCI